MKSFLTMNYFSFYFNINYIKIVSIFSISFIQSTTASKLVDSSDINETIPLIMADSSYFDFLLHHAKNHLEVLKWTTIQKLHQHKRDAIRVRLGGTFDEVGNILVNYRKGESDIEYFFTTKSRQFMNKLKKGIRKAKKQLQGLSHSDGKNVTLTYTNRFLSEIREFTHIFTDEYNRIIPIIFPDSD